MGRLRLDRRFRRSIPSSTVADGGRLGNLPGEDRYAEYDSMREGLQRDKVLLN